MVCRENSLVLDLVDVIVVAALILLVLILGSEIFWHHFHFVACVLVGCCLLLLVACYGRLLSLVCTENSPLVLDFVDVVCSCCGACDTI